MAPLTLLVGENSTGKTSFLAMIRALWDCVYGHRFPNFKEKPFDLGSFDEIIHRHGERSESVPTFEAKIRIGNDWEAEFVFGKEETIPIPIKIRFTDRGNWIEQHCDDRGNPRIRVGTSNGEWIGPSLIYDQDTMISLVTLRRMLPLIIPDVYYPDDYAGPSSKFYPLNGSPPFSKQDAESIKNTRLVDLRHDRIRPFVSAPVRSKPQRTYDPATHSPDPEGDYVPMLLANLARRDDDTWAKLKREMERFGIFSGLFDEIDVYHFGPLIGSPFQIQISKSGHKYNLVDMGYGVSQALPILTELLLPENFRMTLLQQPEVHLHPISQAAMGSLFCEIAAQGRQLVIETHSDYLIDRIRMDVRDGKTELSPEDVSILFFERNNSNVQIHSISLDKMGNVLNAPDSYGRFFMEEIGRSLGL